MRVVIYQIEKNEQLIYNLGILLDKLCLSGKQIGVLCNENDINNIDKGLWTFSTNAFVPHDVVIDDEGVNIKEAYAVQPVLLTQNIIDVADREIICVLDMNNMRNIATMLSIVNEEYQNNHQGKDIIYITYDNAVDEIKNIFPLAQIDVYKKTNGKWQKGQFWFDNKTGKVLYY